jgi:hypothetical protein
LLRCIASLSFTERPAGHANRITSCVGCSLGYAGLPNTYHGSEECSNDQHSCEPRQTLIRFDLLSCELVLLILAPLAGDLFLPFGFVKNDVATFLVEGTGFVMLFLIGQGPSSPQGKRQSKPVEALRL